jgi:hypothetical protein
MAINIFLLLDCIGLVFLIYVLVNFWKEGRRYKNSGHPEVQVAEINRGDGIVVLPPVFLYPKDHNSAIPFPARYRQINLSVEQQKEFAQPIEIQRRLFSEQRASRGRK